MDSCGFVALVAHKAPTPKPQEERSKQSNNMAKKSTKAFNWKGEQGEYIRKQISEGKMPPKPSREQYKAVYEVSEGEVLKFQNFSSSWKNAQRNLKAAEDVALSTGARRGEAEHVGFMSPGGGLMGQAGRATAFFGSPTPGGASVSMKTPRSAKTGGTKKGKMHASGDLYWPTMNSYWHDKDKNLRLCFFVLLPSGTRAEDMSVSIAPGGMKIRIVHKWPEYLFDPQRLFEGQLDRGGGVASNASSAKAAGIVETKETLKQDDSKVVTTNLTIHLEKKVENNMIDIKGDVLSRPMFYKLDGDGPSGAALPTLVMLISCMVERATEGYGGDNDDDVQDYE